MQVAYLLKEKDATDRLDMAESTRRSPLMLQRKEHLKYTKEN